ncbi:tRNA uridine-5-carboxymethylaminomethyl(34) synthesis enzyme MnmG [Schleiferiaceae bacterium]|jgi:tRNA uridine 5-carboxymethylaminomethyl modification enzyme|nr:tRNA uridine-5-carboxymethylaminomethyl(34) synthesis enzyme MnmG [Schleiferiaceae bacterium]MDB2473249.1 tRNA uridine-5-carboxymethylaminomethyl(34) synthesis enzyme MnmG [Schleiferiaceae bacterium]
MVLDEKYDVIVVGGGHAGCEASYCAAKMGANVLLVTMNMQTIGQMSCNPAMGGVAKGQIVREIDALGGGSAVITDKSMIQFRMLNKSKGPAMWSPRVQSDRMLFAQYWRELLEETKGLNMFQDMVTGLLVSDGTVSGVKTALGLTFEAQTVVLTSGTFMNGLIHVGDQNFGGGRAGERASKGITEELIALGFEAGRMKTGTPPRIDGRTIDFKTMEEQKGDENPGQFSFMGESALKNQRSCWITHTSQEVHDTLKKGFDRSPLFNGSIRGTGPRYCPSIEDKIDRFSEKNSHQIFVEPEGWNTVEVYVNGFSTSLPVEIQYEALHKVKGFEQAKFFRPGYAIEYDYFPPTQLKSTLETKLVAGLYFAGQINGTTGYEEAACQGLMAGVNAVLSVRGEQPFVLGRNDAYIGVLIDDLITKGTEEPYRMFTSRAEYRLLLRQDNADLRLTSLGYQIGLAGKDRKDLLYYKENLIIKGRESLDNSLSLKEVNTVLEAKSERIAKEKTKTKKLIARPNISIMDFHKEYSKEPWWQNDVLEQLEIEIKYGGYIAREKENVAKMKRLDDKEIPENFDYYKVKGLSFEGRDKLSAIRPATIAQAGRISGISQSDIHVLLVYMGR